MLIPSKVTRVWSWMSKRHKNALKVAALLISEICAEILAGILQWTLYNHEFPLYMCKSTEICDETLKVLLKIFFRAHLRGQVFLIVCSIYKRNSRLFNVHRMIYFFQNNFLLFKKMAKKPLSSNLSHWAKKRSTQSFKKEIKTRKKSFNSLF